MALNKANLLVTQAQLDRYVDDLMRAPSPLMDTVLQTAREAVLKGRAFNRWNFSKGVIHCTPVHQDEVV